MNTFVVTGDQAIERLYAAESAIRDRGVRRLALFGSVVRDQSRADSDLDVLVEFDPARKGFDNFMALVDPLEERLEHRVELVTIQALSPVIGPHILGEAADTSMRGTRCAFPSPSPTHSL